MENKLEDRCNKALASIVRYGLGIEQFEELEAATKELLANKGIDFNMFYSLGFFLIKEPIK